MAGIKAADLQYILNTIPLKGYQKAFGLDQTFINVMGGLRPGPARIQIPIHYAGNTTAASFAESADLKAADKQSRRMVELGWKRVYVTNSVDGLQEAIANAGGVVNINDLVQQEALDAIQDLLDEINTQMLGDGTGNSAANIDGILYHVDDNNTWCSLSRGSYSWLQSYMSQNSGINRDLTETLLRTVHNTLIDTRKSNYDAILCGSTAADAYEALMGDSKRYTDVQIGDVAMKALAFKQRPIIPIPGYTENRFDFIKRSEWAAYYLPQVSRDSYGRQIQGPFKVEPYYAGTDDTTFIIIAYVQLVCFNPWHQGCLDDVE